MNKIHNSLFYSDVQAGGKYPAYKLKEYERNNISLQTIPEDFKLLESYTCDFISFSCYGSTTFTSYDFTNTGGGNMILGKRIGI